MASAMAASRILEEAEGIYISIFIYSRLQYRYPTENCFIKPTLPCVQTHTDNPTHLPQAYKGTNQLHKKWVRHRVLHETLIFRELILLCSA